VTDILSVSGAIIHLSVERWRHVFHRHPEVASLKENILETVAAPDLIQEGDNGELLALKFYQQTPLGSKWLAVVYREEEEGGFIITAYLTRRPAKRNIVWKR
jgi:hypothetical protein